MLKEMEQTFEGLLRQRFCTIQEWLDLKELCMSYDNQIKMQLYSFYKLFICNIFSHFAQETAQSLFPLELQATIR